MENCNYYFIKFIASNNYEEGKDLQIETTANLIVGDIIDFRNEPYSETLKNDFKADEFLIKKRVFISDSDFENVGGVYNLYLEPILK